MIASRKINETTKGWQHKLHSSFCMHESFEENKTIENGRAEEFEDRAMRMKSCAYCGRIHPADYVCPKKPKMKAKDNNTLAGKLRSSYRWQKLRDEVKARDKYICQCCLRNYPGTVRQVEYDRLSVHHIIPIEKLAAEDIEKAFDLNNLITLCDRHHEAAEAGEIPIDELISIAKENGECGQSAADVPPA